MNKLKNIPYYAWLLLFAGTGLISAFWQTGQKIHSLKDPEAPLSCNISPVVECGSVLDNSLSAVMGVPNSMIGIVFFSALVTIGLLLGFGLRLSKRAKRFLLALVAIMFGFTGWFYLASLYSIGKICIFCIAIWISIVPLTVLTLKEYGDSVLSKKHVAFIQTYYTQIITSVYTVGIILFLLRFREYYFGS